jgi:hypothetical protein
MSVLSVPPSRSTLPRLALPRSARTLGLEFKRNAVPYVLPLLAAAFYFNTVRTADGYPPVWTLRASAIPNDMLFEFSVFAGGLAAWAGSREGRRKTADLVATTPRAAWARLSLGLAGTLCWLLLAFLAGVAVLYVQTALQATWGGPPLWPVFVGATGVTVVTVIGFTAGVLFPGRFTAPLVAIGVVLLDQVGFREALSATTGGGASLLPSSPASAPYALLSPSSSTPLVDVGVYYHVAPDVAMVQVMFMGGIAVALFGLLGLVPWLRDLASAGGLRSLRAVFARADGWLLRAVTVILIACGVAASWTAFALAGTARIDAVTGGWEIPALHSAASDQPAPFTPDCSGGSAFQVCVHPAFGFYLSDVAAALDPVAAEIAGLPGAPVRAEEVASVSGGLAVMGGTSGNPPVFQFTAEHVGTMFGEFNGILDASMWRQAFQQALLGPFLTVPAQQTAPSRSAGPGPLPTPAQQAVANGLLIAVGSQPSLNTSLIGENGKPDAATWDAITAAAQRFAHLSASARHAWLATHLAALRAGTITVAQIP